MASWASSRLKLETDPLPDSSIKGGGPSRDHASPARRQSQQQESRPSSTPKIRSKWLTNTAKRLHGAPAGHDLSRDAKMPPQSSARIVRRAPLLDRIRALLNPTELALWAWEEVNSHDWEEFDRQWSTALGLGLNVVFVLARMYSAATSNGDDIFEDYDWGTSGAFAWMVRSPSLTTLREANWRPVLVSCTNSDPPLRCECSIYPLSNEAISSVS